jgi:hypothetical protein
VALDLRQQHEGLNVGAAPDPHTESVVGDRDEFVDDEMERWRERLLGLHGDEGLL